MANSEVRGATVPVAIVGAGPVGLALALGLARHGVRSVLLERRDATSEHSKAPAVHIRTREVLRSWGVEERLLDAGRLEQRIVLQPVDGGRPLLAVDLAELDDEAERPGLLLLPQADTERLLLEALRESGACDVRFGAEVTGVRATADHVDLQVREGAAARRVAAAYAVGCDGAGSFVRTAVGLPFDGITYRLRPMLADVRLGDERDAPPWLRARNTRGAFTFAARLDDDLWRIVHLAGSSPDGEDGTVSDREVTRRVREMLGPGPAEVVWSSRFRIHRRASPRFRSGRVLLAGDAAHVHSPVGGQGMNAGIQDAANLAWKLAAALDGGDRDALLDSYDEERRAVVVGSISRVTDLLTRFVLQAPGALRRAAFALQRAAVTVPRVRRLLLRRMTMLDLDYPPSRLLDARELAAGVRLPNPRLRHADGTPQRLHDLLGPRPALVQVGGAAHPAAELPLPDVVRVGPGGVEDPGGGLRRLLGGADGWLLVRPDTHVAWGRPRGQPLAAAVRAALGRGEGS
jgi:2-polyprenyl-6-methoxyphenol hydroxylase-like FAD-dependent oxidoreductase